MAALMRYMQLGEVERRQELYVLMVLGIMEGFSWTLIKPMLPLFATSLGATAFLVGLIMAVPPLIQIFTRIQSGQAAVRYGKRRMIIASFIATITGAGLFTVTRAVPLLFVAQVFVALGESLFWPAKWAYVTSLAPRRHQGRLVALVMGVQGVAGLAMPYIGGRVFDLWGFWLNGLMYTAFALIGLLLAFRLPLVETTGGAGTEGVPQAQPTPGVVAGRAPTGLRAARILLAREWIMLAAWSGLIIFFSWGISGAFYGIYVRDHLGFTATTVGLLMTWQGAFITVARFTYARSADRFPVDKILMLSIFVNAFPLMLLPLVRTLPLLMLVSAVTGCAVSVIPVAMKTMYANATSDGERSLAMGIDGVAMNAGALISPVLSGAMATAIGVPMTFFVGNLLTIGALAMSRRVSRSRSIVRWLSGREPQPFEEGEPSAAGRGAAATG